MKSVSSGWALAALVVPLIAGGCATQQAPGGAASEASRPAAPAAQQVAAAATPAPPTDKVVFTMPEPTAMEVQYGVQLAHVGLTAAGGLVDVRFKVLDAGKARVLLGNAAHMPMLVAGDNPPLMPPHHALKGARFGNGQVFFILYPNQRNAVRPGVDVAVAVGDVKLGPVKAQ